mmetsp:Transcript_10799/g.30939  ORF Transcript_10799/g.30939 Transcript_10799/m.30939 type:complete len:919 (-) Transcript_10799:73-2829(-)
MPPRHFNSHNTHGSTKQRPVPPSASSAAAATTSPPVSSPVASSSSSNMHEEAVYLSPIQQVRAKLKKTRKVSITQQRREEQERTTKQRQALAKQDLERRQAIVIQAFMRRHLAKLEIERLHPKYAWKLKKKQRKASAGTAMQTPPTYSKPSVSSKYGTATVQEEADDDEERISPFLAVKNKLKTTSNSSLVREDDYYTAQKKRHQKAYKTRLQVARMDLERRESTKIQALARGFLVRRPRRKQNKDSREVTITSPALSSPTPQPPPPITATMTPKRSFKPGSSSSSSSSPKSTTNPYSYVPKSAPVRPRKAVVQSFVPPTTTQQKKKQPSFMTMKNKLKSHRKSAAVMTGLTSTNDDGDKATTTTNTRASFSATTLLSPTEGYQKRKKIQKSAYQSRLEIARMDLERRESTKIQSVVRMFLVRCKRQDREEIPVSSSHSQLSSNRTPQSAKSSWRSTAARSNANNTNNKQMSGMMIGALPFGNSSHRSPVSDDSDSYDNTSIQSAFSSSRRQQQRKTTTTRSPAEGYQLQKERQKNAYQQRLLTAKMDHQRRQATLIQSIVRMFQIRCQYCDEIASVRNRATSRNDDNNNDDDDEGELSLADISTVMKQREAYGSHNKSASSFFYNHRSTKTKATTTTDIAKQELSNTTSVKDRMKTITKSSWQQQASKATTTTNIAKQELSNTTSLQDRMKHLKDRKVVRRSSSSSSNTTNNTTTTTTTKPRRVLGPYSKRNMTTKKIPSQEILSPVPTTTQKKKIMSSSPMISPKTTLRKVEMSPRNTTPKTKIDYKSMKKSNGTKKDTLNYIPPPMSCDSNKEETRSQLKTKLWKLKLQMKLLQNEISKEDTSSQQKTKPKRRRRKLTTPIRSSSTFSCDNGNITKYTREQRKCVVRLQAFIRGCLCRMGVDRMITSILDEMKDE